jgi:RNA polymerase sigma factor (sigma-70 family)
MRTYAASDQRLVEQVQAGSERAFEALFDRHRRPVLALCRRMLGSRQEAEDATQQTFLAAYRDLIRCEVPDAVRPWLYAIARNRCLTLLRARREDPVDRLPEAATDQMAAELAVREDLRTLIADMARLPEDQRSALVLAEFGDLSHEEIARILVCPRDKVKALVFQARSSLAAARSARETPCAEIRELLTNLRGGALRRATLRRHLHECPSCRAFREELRDQRQRRALLLPVGPVLGFKRAILNALFGPTGVEASGAAVSAGALGTGGLVATAVVAVAIPVGGLATRATPSRDSDRAAATAIVPAATGRAVPRRPAASTAERARPVHRREPHHHSKPAGTPPAGGAEQAQQATRPASAPDAGQGARSPKTSVTAAPADPAPSPKPALGPASPPRAANHNDKGSAAVTGPPAHAQGVSSPPAAQPHGVSGPPAAQPQRAPAPPAAQPQAAPTPPAAQPQSAPAPPAAQPQSTPAQQATHAQPAAPPPGNGGRLRSA